MSWTTTKTSSPCPPRNGRAGREPRRLSPKVKSTRNWGMVTVVRAVARKHVADGAFELPSLMELAQLLDLPSSGLPGPGEGRELTVESPAGDVLFGKEAVAFPEAMEDVQEALGDHQD